MNTVCTSQDGVPRCSWCSAAPEFLDYHDNEWGYPVADDMQLFEKLCLESFQSGLSWRTILVKRENFRAAFAGFDFDRVARFTEQDIDDRLLNNKGIVRHRGKILAVIHNAQRAQALVTEYGSLAAFFWQHEPQTHAHTEPQMVSQSAESLALAQALKKRGWKFVGPTTVYAFMQAMGLVNDHAHGCIQRAVIETTRQQFTRPIAQKL